MERAIWSDRRHWAWAAGLVVSLMMALASPVQAVDRQLIDQVQQAERAALAGITGLRVIIAEMSTDAERDGLTRSTLQTDVELKLRQAGIRILSFNEWNETPSAAILYLDIHPFKDELGLYALCINLQLNQGVQLLRDPTAILAATTWKRSYTGTVGKRALSLARDSARDLVDIFINDYLAANPKK